ncbi:MAG: DUF4091 domain-containing protein [Lentisphaeria bacterium]|nr:DUF4091 domain-containing protein [Lentisphaeria bacterium]
MALKSWLSTTSVRFYPGSAACRYRALTLDGALNERLSFQVAMRMDDKNTQRVAVEVAGPDGWTLRVRRVGYVPVRHLNTAAAEGSLEVEGLGHVPGYVPDPLFDETFVDLASEETHAFWVTVVPAADATPGEHTLTITVTPERGGSQKREAKVLLHTVRLAPRQDFAITHWFYADSICDWYDVAPFSAEFWPLCEAYLKNYADHGLTMIYVPAFTPPLDGVKRPTQLLKVTDRGDGNYAFDWSDVKRWVELAKKSGLTEFEWTHPFTQWGVKHAIRIYHDQGLDERLLWPADTPATGTVYRNFLGQYLPELKTFLQAEGILDRTVFHVSDEPHNEDDKANYVAARALLRELAPWMKTMDALTDVAYGHEHLTDMPVPSIRTAMQFHEQGIESWCYYCCGPRGAFLQRLMDTPLAKIWMHGLLFYRWPFKGFLHWGYNYWYRSQTRELIDPYSVQDGHKWPGWAYGDTFVVYPGPDGPIDSLRWEVFAESLQDYQLLQALGVSRDDKLLAPLRAFDDFPKTEAWRTNLRRALFSRADNEMS